MLSCDICLEKFPAFFIYILIGVTLGTKTISNFQMNLAPGRQEDKLGRRLNITFVLIFPYTLFPHNRECLVKKGQCSEQGLFFCVFSSCYGQIQNTKLVINSDDHCPVGEATAQLLYEAPTGPRMTMI